MLYAVPMPQNLTNFDKALKDNYGPGLRESINNSNPILTEVSKNTEDIIGRKAVWSLHSSRSASTGARGEGDALPTAGNQGYLAPEDRLKFVYHTIKVSGQAMALSRGDNGAFLRALESEMRGAERDLKNDIARQIFGQKVTVNSALVSGVIATVDTDPGTGSTITFANEAKSITRQFFPDMAFAVIDAATGSVRAGGPYVVQSTDPTAGTVTITGTFNAAVAVGDVIVRCDTGSTSANSLDDEINGLRFLINDTQTYAGISPATYSVWKSQTAGSASTGISELVIDEICEKVETDGNGDTPTLYVTEHVQRRKLASMLQSQKRYDGREVTLKAGWKGLEISRGTLLVDRYCPSNKLFALTPAELSWFVGLDWDWDSDDGKVLFKALDGSDAVEGRYKGYLNLNATNRNSHGVVTLAEPTF